MESSQSRGEWVSPSFPPDHVQSAWFWGSGSLAFTLSSLPWKTQSRDGISVLPSERHTVVLLGLSTLK